MVKSDINAAALLRGDADVLQTLLFFNTPLVQSGNAALAVVTRSRATAVKVIDILAAIASTARVTWGYPSATRLELV